MRTSLRLRITVAASASVALLALAGCARESTPAAAYNAGGGYAYNQPQPAASNQTGIQYGDNGVQNGNPAIAPGAPAMYDDRQAGPRNGAQYAEASVAPPCAQPVGYGYATGYTTPSYAQRYAVRTVRPRVVVERPVAYETRVVRRHGRSTGTSVAIVAGSAGVGAAIGAIAGGGKGAGIGALAGGGGGFIYDRLTHNR